MFEEENPNRTNHTLLLTTALCPLPVPTSAASPSLLPPPSNPPHRARQADHLTTSTTATGPSPSNVKPAWNVALTTQTHGKEGECGSSKWREMKGWRKQLVSFKTRWEGWAGELWESSSMWMKVTVRASEALLTTPPTSTLHSLWSVSGSQASRIWVCYLRLQKWPSSSWGSVQM